MSLTYWDYLRLEDLLNLQEPRSTPHEHDEMLFIIIHQTYELWFKLLLHELDKVGRDFASDDLFGAIHTFKRMRTVMKTLVQQVDILETMTPMSFTSFRDRLDTASGFQSALFRELEFTLGYKRPEMMKYQTASSTRRANVQKRLDDPSLIEHFHEFLARRGVVSPREDRQIAAESEEAFHEALVNVYKSKPEVAILLELMTDFDEGFQEWRYRHIKLVERTIGAKKGTGGSLGVEFLKQSLFKPVFPELWAIRHKL